MGMEGWMEKRIKGELKGSTVRNMKVNRDSRGRAPFIHNLDTR